MKLKVLLVFLAFSVSALSQQIKTIRVVPIDSPCCSNSPGEDDVMTNKLISHLVQHGIVVLEGESDQPTDAVLHVNYQARQVGAYVRFEGPARLTDVNGRVIWADEVRTPPFTRSPSASFTDVIARRLEDFLSHQPKR